MVIRHFEILLHLRWIRQRFSGALLVMYPQGSRQYHNFHAVIALKLSFKTLQLKLKGSMSLIIDCVRVCICVFH